MSDRSLVAVAAGISVLLGTGAAESAMITYQFGGVLSNAHEPNALGLQSGDSFAGAFYIDSDAQDQYPLDATRGYYQSPTAWMTLVAGPWTFEASGLVCWVDVRNDTLDGDRAAIGAGYFSFADFTDVGVTVLWSGSSSLWADDRLQSPPQDIAVLGTYFGLAGSRTGYGDFLVEGTLNYLAPEPCSACLALLLGGLMLRGRPRNRRSTSQ